MGVLAALAGPAILALAVLLSTSTTTRLSGPPADLQFVGPMLTIDQLRDIASGKAVSPVGIEWFDRVHRVDTEARSVYPDDTRIDLVQTAGMPSKLRRVREYGFPLPWLSIGSIAALDGWGASTNKPPAQPSKWVWNAGGYSLSDPFHICVFRPAVVAFIFVAVVAIALGSWTLFERAFVHASRGARRIGVTMIVLSAMAVLGGLPTQTVDSGSLVYGLSGIPIGLTLGDVRAMRVNPKAMQEFASRLVKIADDRARNRDLSEFPRPSETNPPLLQYYSDREWPIRITTWSVPFISPVLTARTRQEVDSKMSPTCELWKERGGVELVVWKRASHEAVKLRMPYTAIAGALLVLFAPLVSWLMGRAVLEWIKSRRRIRVGACLACGYEGRGVSA